MRNGKSSRSFKLTEASKEQKNKSILLTERSSRRVALPFLSGAHVSPWGGFPY